MVHETTNDPRNEPTSTAKKSVENLPSSTESADNNFVSSDVDNCTVILEDLKRRMIKKYRNNLRITITKRLLIVRDSIVKKIEPYKMKKSTKYVTTVKSIPGATTEGMSHHVKGCMVDFALISCSNTTVQMI